MNYQDALVKVIEGTGTPSAKAKTLANAIMQSPFVKEITNDFVSLAGERNNAKGETAAWKARVQHLEEKSDKTKVLLERILARHTITWPEYEAKYGVTSLDEDAGTLAAEALKI